MGQQKGIFKITGTIGDVTFYKSKNGYLVREKGGIDAKRLATDPAFQRTRENGMEFGRAGKAGKTLRAAMRQMLTNVRSANMTARLTRLMIKVIQADAVNPRGLRNVIDGEAELLAGFEFNSAGTLSTTLHAPYTAEINRVTGKLTVEIPSFIPVDMITAPPGTTHYKIITGGALVDFEAEAYENGLEATAVLPYGAVATTAISHEIALKPASTNPLFLALGMEFYQEVNGEMYALRNGSFNPLAMVGVNGGV